MNIEHPQEYVVLGLLMGHERHGYEIHRSFSSGVGRIWYAGMSQVYALLKRLELSGKVVSTVALQDKRPAKKIYSITSKGREDFLNWVFKPLERIRDLRLDFLAKLFFMRELKLPGVDDLIRNQSATFQEQLQAINQEGEACDDDFDHLVRRFRIAQIEAVLSWLDECEQYVNH